MRRFPNVFWDGLACQLVGDRVGREGERDVGWNKRIMSLCGNL